MYLFIYLLIHLFFHFLLSIRLVVLPWYLYIKLITLNYFFYINYKYILIQSLKTCSKKKNCIQVILSMKSIIIYNKL